MIKKTLFCSALAILVASCSTTNPGNGAYIEYYLPKTNVDLTLIMSLDSCGTDSIDDVKITVKLAVLATPGRESRPVRILGEDLASFRTRRVVKVNVHDTGVLSGVNTTVEDKTAVIVSNALTTATNLRLLSDLSGEPSGRKIVCSADAKKKLKNIATLEKIVSNYTALLSKENYKGSRVKIAKEINTISLEIARNRLTYLTTEIRAPLPLGDAPLDSKQSLAFALNDQVKGWFRTKAVSPPYNIPSRQITENDFRSFINVVWSTKAVVPISNTQNFAKKTLKKCRRYLSVPPTRNSILTIDSTSNSQVSVSGINMVIPVPQWGGSEKICLDAAIAENRSFGISFDKFGRRNNFDWTSEARGEVFSGALGSISNAASSLNSNPDEPSTIDQQKAKIDQINTQLQYNNALLCEAAAAAGATSCESE